ncbi:MAG: ACP S-malonyltransferase [Spirochaetia bacterium]
MVFCHHMKTCFLFPGQGAQYPGMAKDLWEESNNVRELFQKASDVLEMDMKKLLFESTPEELKVTEKTQVAMTLACLCSAMALRERGVELQGCAGFSLGEYAALCEAGVIKREDVFPIVKARGQVMEKAARALDSAEGASGMAAVLGLPAERVAAVVETLAAYGVFLSNYNSPGQVVVSGTAKGLAKAEEALKAAGAKRFIRLQVSGPFHSPLMAEARAGFDEALASFTFFDPVVPLYSNVTGGRIHTAAEARELCGKQLVSMVRWVAEEESMLADGYGRFLEAGPGTVLTGLMRALRPEVRCAPAGTLENIAKALAAFPVDGGLSM